MPDSKRPDRVQSDAPLEIRSSKLTSCSILDKGDTIVLGLVSSGTPVSLKLPFEHAQSVLMTLPHVLTRALRLRTGSEASRYVFQIDTWTLEGVDGQESLILTLKTSDGFEASFGISLDVCRSLARSLGRESGGSGEAGGWTQ